MFTRRIEKLIFLSLSQTRRIEVNISLLVAPSTFYPVSDSYKTSSSFSTFIFSYF
jgi:hypothetical protein